MTRGISATTAPLLLGAAMAFAQVETQWQPPTIWAESRLPEPSGAADLVPQITIGSFRIVLEQTALSEVASHFGALVGRARDASESLRWVCLGGKDQGGPWGLWVESGEIHGSMVGGFLLVRLGANEALDSRCIATKHARISLPVALRLGASKAEAVKVLGPPTLESEARLLYYHQRVVKLGSKTGGAAQPFDLSTTLYLRLRRGVVDALQVWRTTSS